MTIEIINGQRIERSDEDKWLHDSKPDYTRYFTNVAALAEGAEPLPECTDEYRKQWEREHQPESPEQQQEV